MPLKNLYFVNASQIHNTTGVFNMGNWHKDTQEILLKDIFDIDAEFVRWNPIFTELSQYLHKLKKWDGDLHHEMSYANESKNDIYFRRSQIHEQVKVSCQRLIACTKEVLEHKMKMVFDMAKHVTTEQIVKFWNLLKFCLEYLWWLYFEDKIPDTTKTVLFEAQAHIDECILNASATFPSQALGGAGPAAGMPRQPQPQQCYKQEAVPDYEEQARAWSLLPEDNLAGRSCAARERLVYHRRAWQHRLLPAAETKKCQIIDSQDENTKSRAGAVRKTERSDRGKPRACAVCRKPGHKQNTCPQAYCMRCRNPGHSADYCKIQPCLHCGAENEHYPINCPDRPRKAQRKAGQ